MDKNITTWQIATTYMGTIVGAGFASGQETLNFFTYYGSKGLLGVLLSTLGFIGFGIAVLLLGRRFRVSSHREIFRVTCGPWLGTAVDLLVTFFLIATMTVMLAGAGAIFEEHLGLSAYLGIIITLTACSSTLYFGVRGVLKANTIVVPLLVLLISGVGLYSLYHHGLNWQVTDIDPERLRLTHNWLVSALLYVSYNLILAVTVLGPLGAQVQSRKKIVLGGLWGGLGLGLLSLIMTMVVLVHFPRVTEYEVPMLFVVSPYSAGLRLLFTLVLWCEVFTTLIGNMYGVGLRLTEIVKADYRLVACASLLLSACFTNLRFSVLVSVVYPLLGYVSMIFLIALCIKVVRIRF